MRQKHRQERVYLYHFAAIRIASETYHRLVCDGWVNKPDAARLRSDFVAFTFCGNVIK